MSPRRTLSLLAALAVLSPLAAIAAPACMPGQHCPMAALAGDGPPCHGTAMQADDCCLSAAAEAAEAVPVAAAKASAAGEVLPVPRPETGAEVPLAERRDTPSTPLYRLFRALLI